MSECLGRTLNSARHFLPILPANRRRKAHTQLSLERTVRLRDVMKLLCSFVWILTITQILQRNRPLSALITKNTKCAFLRYITDACAIRKTLVLAIISDNMTYPKHFWQRASGTCGRTSSRPSSYPPPLPQLPCSHVDSPPPLHPPLP